jgi:hypothetical protein
VEEPYLQVCSDLAPALRKYQNRSTNAYICSLGVLDNFAASHTVEKLRCEVVLVLVLAKNHEVRSK